MKFYSLAFVLASIAAPILAASTLGCSSSESTSEDGVGVVRSSLARNTSPVISDADLATFQHDRASFAVDLYQAVRKTTEHSTGDIFLSPHSVSTALAMTYAGATGQTQAEMKQALHFTLSDASIHAAFDQLDLALSSRGKGASGQDGQPFRLNLANALFGHKGGQFQAPFLDTLAVNYGAGLNVVDFAASEDARSRINGWVENKTEDRIKDLIPQGVLDGSTRFVLVNAVYFNAAWAAKFNAAGTSPSTFTKLDGSTTSVEMMHGTTSRRYLAGDGFEAVEMPYDGNELSMLVIAPTKGAFASFESAMSGAKVLEIFDGLAFKSVNLAFPKLKLDANFTLNEPLKALGMKSAFESGGLSAIEEGEDLSIKAVLHKTFLAIDENGTEAAAATAVIGEKASADIDEPVAVNIDRPFITAIIDRQTKTLVFLGRILEPKN
ncbi:serpin family protein [Labilithrix luteola]|nr:serpin family protein [Labilithrix luteola]